MRFILCFGPKLYHCTLYTEVTFKMHVIIFSYMYFGSTNYGIGEYFN